MVPAAHAPRRWVLRTVPGYCQVDRLGESGAEELLLADGTRRGNARGPHLLRASERIKHVRRETIDYPENCWRLT